jgi:hypothetical protein
LKNVIVDTPLPNRYREKDTPAAASVTRKGSDYNGEQGDPMRPNMGTETRLLPALKAAADANWTCSAFVESV